MTTRTSGETPTATATHHAPTATMTAGWGTKDDDGSGETPTATTTTSGGAPNEALNGSGGRRWL